MKNSISIREYETKDFEEIINLLRLNTPEYFAAEEEADFINYLKNERELYYVLLFDEVIIGCGGINFEENKTIGKISWDILHPEYQGKGLGSQLLKHRIQKLQSMDAVAKIMVRTSQVAYKFYEKHGFQLVEYIKDYWAEGFDMNKMEYTQDQLEKNSQKS
ncbi:MAG: GNAT family N-acetyltransferase [Saprospiraceae bacterium]|nr:GNAT family N-acetyltransferase [Saprospiraceae bacterium]MBK7809949.1 GNAT family N-acetyltransferase [Saprospiraceae bacterium]MBK9629553.1 GNAT family N-acetyltransferase [Saprospiraceae bacterium]